MKKLFIILNILLLSACFNAFDVDVHQGNHLTLQQIDQLEEGMSQEQVRDLLGSASIIDTFHNNRWDYINSSYLPNDNSANLHIILEFDKNKILKDITKKDITQLKN